MKKSILRIAWCLAPVFLCYIGTAREPAPPEYFFIASSADGTYREPSTKLEFPATLGGLKRGKVHEYEDPRLGLSIPYNVPGIVVTVYFYNLGLKSIPDGISAPVRKEIESNKMEIYEAKRQKIYQAVKHVSDWETTLGSAKNAPKALRANYELTRDDAKKVSIIYLSGYRNQFLKIRCTYASEGEKEYGDIFDKFVEELGALMKGQGPSPGDV